MSICNLLISSIIITLCELLYFCALLMTDLMMSNLNIFKFNLGKVLGNISSLRVLAWKEPRTMCQMSQRLESGQEVTSNETKEGHRSQETCL